LTFSSQVGTLLLRVDVIIELLFFITLTWGGRMNKTDLVKRVSEKNNIGLKAAKMIVESFFDGMTETLNRGERIEIRGFGSFSVRHYGAYKGRHPKTGKIVDVLPKKLPFFKVGKELKETVNK
jgi:integration host factor subunit beta